MLFVVRANLKALYNYSTIILQILAHMLWGTKVFVGTIFTDAPINSLAVNEILAKAGSA